MPYAIPAVMGIVSESASGFPTNLKRNIRHSGKRTALVHFTCYALVIGRWLLRVCSL